MGTKWPKENPVNPRTKRASSEKYRDEKPSFWSDLDNWLTQISPLENPYEIRNHKALIATLNTELRQRQLAENPSLKTTKKNKKK